MDGFSPKDMEEACQTIVSMIGRSEKAQAKFAEGTPQHTLQRNRIKALSIASALIAQKALGGDAADAYSEEDLEQAVAPIASLMHKSEKAQQKLAQGSWQHTMLGNNLRALSVALPLLAETLCAMRAQRGN